MTQQEMNLTANDRQVGGKHYKKHPLEHWDTVALFNLDYFQASAWKYILRWRDKNGLQDLEKARHYLDKYIEIETLRANGVLTKALLERAVRELENIQVTDEATAAYLAAAKGDDPVGDVLSPFPFAMIDDEDECQCMSLQEHNDFVTLEKCKGLWKGALPTFIDAPLEVGDQPDDDARFRRLVDDDPPAFAPPDPSGCTHDSVECPVHPNGGCPPRHELVVSTPSALQP